MSDAGNSWHGRFDELVGELRDGELTEEQSAELNAMLDLHAGARHRFAEQMQLAALLEDEVALGQLEESNSGAPANRFLAKPGYWSAAVGLACSIAACVALVVWFRAPGNLPGGELARTVPEPTPVSFVQGDDETIDEGVAVVTRAFRAQWANDDVPLDAGSTVTPGLFELESGLVQLEFYSGAVVIVEGPASLEFVDSEKLVCHTGKLRARVPPAAHGFTVLTGQFELVDLGTEFGVDIADDGSASVHVFDGKVEIYEPGSNRSMATHRALDATSAVSVSVDGTRHDVRPEPARFISASELQRLDKEESKSRLAQWREYSDGLKSDPRVIVQYSFERHNDDPRVLVSQKSDDRSLDGAIIGCSWSAGRWPGKDSLEFKRPGDRVRVNIPGSFDSMTWSAWVRIDGLDRAFNSLLLTDGWASMRPHWQIRKMGELILGVRNSEAKSHRDYLSEPLIDVFSLGRWTNLVTVYDNANREVRHYVDGELSAREALVPEAKGPLGIGEATIGNWLNPVSPTSNVRNLNGRIDELVLFKTALTDVEVRDLYEAGKPQ
ncbi:FecR protein [Planctomycetes bacterium Pan216]|uniref:FecR protein n=1 Tax=Kolteria novifilia TaxID=2527975 RepID=A0A518BBD7_9BACT|nr:FecR protein [Planctomycetes bacterium Pan216]